MKKLVCDRCGKELTEQHDIDMAFVGMKAWQASVRARGGEPRGIIPCEYYVSCGGEMILVDDSSNGHWHQLLKKLFRH